MPPRRNDWTALADKTRRNYIALWGSERVARERYEARQPMLRQVATPPTIPTLAAVPRTRRTRDARFTVDFALDGNRDPRALGFALMAAVQQALTDHGRKGDISSGLLDPGGDHDPIRYSLGRETA